jgi:hypothetical protein
MRLSGYVADMGEARNAYKILIRKPEGKESLRGPRDGWKDNIKVPLRKIRWKGVDWMHLDQWQGIL